MQLERIKHCLEDNNVIILDYTIDQDGEYTFNCNCSKFLNYKKLNEMTFGDTFLYIKNENKQIITLKTKTLKNLVEVRCNRYLYHVTYKNCVENILKEGLTPKKLNGILSNHPAIYLINSKFKNDLWLDLFLGNYCSLIRIDTYKCINTFYYDINDKLNKNTRKRAVMTYDHIPPVAITFIRDMNISCDEESMNLIEYYRNGKTILSKKRLFK